MTEQEIKTIDIRDPSQMEAMPTPIMLDLMFSIQLELARRLEQYETATRN